MNSSEAIKHIKIQTVDNNFNLKKESIEAIENDLKILEIIKRNFLMIFKSSYLSNGNTAYQLYLGLDDKDINEIINWLNKKGE